MLITRTLGPDAEFRKVLSNRDIELTEQSFIDIRFEEEADFPSSDWVFFSSPECARSYFSLTEKRDSIKYAALGSGTAQVAAQWTSCNFIGDDSSMEEIAAAFQVQLGDAIVLFPQGNLSRRSIQKQLPAVQVIDDQTYSTHPQGTAVGPQDFIAFTSPSNVDGFFQANRIGDARSVAMSNTTAEAVRKQGVECVVADGLSGRAMAESILQLLD